MGAQYTVGTGPASGAAPLAVLDVYQSLRLSFPLDGPPTAQLKVRGTAEAATYLRELADDVWVYRRFATGGNAELLFRGRVTASTDDWDADTLTTVVVANGYRALLDRRFVLEGDQAVFAGADQGTILWSLVNLSQGRSGGGLGITVGTGGTTGVVRDRTYEAGQNIGQLCSQLGNVTSGFDWEVDPLLKLNVFYPSRGTDRGVVLDYGGLAAQLRRTFNPGDFANVVRVAGDALTLPKTSASATIATDPRGRWESNFGFPDVVEQTTVDARAGLLLTVRSKPSYGWTATLRRDRWEGVGHIWLGDTVRLAVKTPPRVTTDPGLSRVVQVDLAYDERGAENVVLTLEQAA